MTYDFSDSECTPTCFTGPGCRTSALANTFPTGANCCDDSSKCYSCDAGYTWDGYICKPPPSVVTDEDDDVKPVVTSIGASPTTVETSSPVTVSYTVTDNNALGQVELWRKKEAGSWAKISTKTVSGTSVSSSFTDSISTAGSYYYSVHVVDKAGNTGEGPEIKVVVTGSTYLSVVPGLRGFGTETRAAYGAANPPEICIVDSLLDTTGNPSWTPSGYSVGVFKGTLIQCLEGLDTLNGETIGGHVVKPNSGKVVLFEVSGTINQLGAHDNDGLYRYKVGSYTIVAGQTSPKPGILFRNIAIFGSAVHDILIQHVRGRMAGPPTTNYGLHKSFAFPSGTIYPTYNIVIDHVSAAWGEDSQIEFYKQASSQHDLTMSNCILSESRETMGLTDEEALNGKNSLIGGPSGDAVNSKNILVYGNLFSNSKKRNPRVRQSAVAVVNNYMYNNYEFSVQLDATTGPAILSLVGNVVDAGPMSNGRSTKDDILYLGYPQWQLPVSQNKVYLYDTKTEAGTQADSTAWDMNTLVYASNNNANAINGYLDFKVTGENPSTDSPIWPEGLHLMKSSEVKDYIIANAGAYPAFRDSLDTRFINEMITGTGPSHTVQGAPAPGDWPVLAENKITLDIPSNPHGDNDGDGYTNLEEWLHCLACDVEGRVCAHCEDTSGGSVYYVSTSTKIVNGNNFCGGKKCTSADTIIIKGGARGNLLFQDFDGAGSYITITNEDKNPASRVVITNDGSVGWGVLSLFNCKYIDLNGDNDADLQYGIKVINDGTPARSGTVWVYGKSDHIKISYLETSFEGNTGLSGIGIQVQDSSLTTAWTFSNFEIHHNYIHDTRYSGMYLGHNDPSDTNNPYIGAFSIHDNLLEDLGLYGITFKGVNAANNYIYKNTVRRTGVVREDLTDNFKFGISVRTLKPEYLVEIYENRIEHTVGAGIMVRGPEHLIRDNLILGCGSGNDLDWGHGIILLESAAKDIEINDNTIIQAYRYGIYGGGGVTSVYHNRNLIGDCGLGEAGGTNLIEGTGANANIYHANVADFGFKAWSDDNNYINDIFEIV